MATIVITSSTKRRCDWANMPPLDVSNAREKPFIPPPRNQGFPVLPMMNKAPYIPGWGICCRGVFCAFPMKHPTNLCQPSPVPTILGLSSCAYDPLTGCTKPLVRSCTCPRPTYSMASSRHTVHKSCSIRLPNPSRTLGRRTDAKMRKSSCPTRNPKRQATRGHLCPPC